MIELDSGVILFRLLSLERFEKSGITFGDLRECGMRIQGRSEFRDLFIYPQINTPSLEC